MSVDCMTALSALGHIHSHIGAPQQGCDIEAMLRSERDSNTSSDLEGVVSDQKGSLERAKEGPCSVGRSGGIGRGKHNGKLISSQPGDEIGGTQISLQARTDL